MAKGGDGAYPWNFRDKRFDVIFTEDRHVVGVARSVAQLMSIVLDLSVGMVSPTEKDDHDTVVARGNIIIIMMWENPAMNAGP